MDEWSPIHGETPIDPSDIKDRSIKTRAQLNAAEAENIRKAVMKYLLRRPSKRQAPFDYAWFCKLHQEMFGNIFLSAGQPRTQNLNLGVPWEHVPNKMMELAEDLAAGSKGESTRCSNKPSGSITAPCSSILFSTAMVDGRGCSPISGCIVSPPVSSHGRRISSGDRALSGLNTFGVSKRLTPGTLVRCWKSIAGIRRRRLTDWRSGFATDGAGRSCCKERGFFAPRRCKLAHRPLSSSAASAPGRVGFRPAAGK